MMWQAVFFDFDGVILNSADVKTKAFGKMFRPFGPWIEAQVIAYHMAHEGISRFEKFRYFYENIVNKKVNRSKLEKLGEEFSNLVLKEVIEAPFVEGALEAINQLESLKIPAYIISGTPEKELRYIVNARGLTSYFEEIRGSPKVKSEIINEIIRRKGYTSSGCLFIGDAMTDYQAARETGVRFLGIVKNDQTSLFPSGTTTSITVTVRFFSELI